MPKNNLRFVLPLSKHKPAAAPERAAIWFILLPEVCGLIWLGLIAGAVYIHAHASAQPPIYDAIQYYQKAYNFWEAIHKGRWVNPLNVEPTFRPPGTILMSYPTGFEPDPRSFYFRSVYFPVALLFLSVLIVAYRIKADFWRRLRAILTAIFFTTITVPYHFEFGAAGDYQLVWGFVDSFLTALAALAAACAWRGTDSAARTWVWAVATGVTSALCILVKPSGVLVAAIIGVGWVALALGSLVDCRPEPTWRLALRLFVGAGLIALIDLVVVAAALRSHYLSRANLAYGQSAIAVMKAELSLPLSLVWKVVNAGLGGAFIVWAALAVIICLWRLSATGAAPMTARSVAACLASLGALICGVWFWLWGSGGPSVIRYFTPFFVIVMVWLVPVVMEAWFRVPAMLRLLQSGVMVAAAINLIALLLVPRPSLAWQQFAGVGVAPVAFPRQSMEMFKQLVAQNVSQLVRFYLMSMDENDAMLESLVDQRSLLDHGSQSLLLQRPIDWQRSSTFRIAEIGAANLVLINPRQALAIPAGQKVNNLGEERGVFTAWADKLDASDGVSIFFSAPSTKILKVTDPVKFRDSLARLVASYGWNPTFARANHLGQH
jgi:hypothetical protein